MNVTDLRDELELRSRPGDDLMGTVRLAAVRHRVRGLRQRRIVAGGATTLIVIVAVITVYGAIGNATTTGPAGAPGATVNGFPLYAMGARLVDTRTVTPPSQQITLTARVGELGITFVQRCDLPGGVRVLAVWQINAVPVATFACGRDDGTYGTPSDTLWSSLRIRPGDVVRVTAMLKRRDVDNDTLDLSHGTFSAALMVRVAFDRYPRPPRPATSGP